VVRFRIRTRSHILILSTQHSALSTYLDERIAAGDFPGCVALVRERGRDFALVAHGNAVVTPELIPVTPETIFDLASLTKTLATTLLVLIESEARRLRLDDPVAAYIPEFDSDDRRHVTLLHLLTHTSGLPKWRPFYAEPGDPAGVVGALGALPLKYETGTRVVYSDPNFILLGIVLERVAGRSLDALFAERVAAPLGLTRTGYTPAPALRPEIAATERGNAFERRMCGDECARFDGWRTDVIWGEVHDGNAHFLGGIAGHAGLFGTASEVVRIAEQFLPGSSLLRSDESFEAVRTNFTPGLEEHRSVGWQLASTPESAAGPALAPESFGHLGFTGTSAWIDPLRERVYVLLTNRVHPTWRDIPMNTIRRRAHELMAAVPSTEPVA
jgi:serine-type D-Ala-D-Ala carboxypeptidase